MDFLGMGTIESAIKELPWLKSTHRRTACLRANHRAGPLYRAGPPSESGRLGREANKRSGFPGTPDIGTDAAQTEEPRGRKRAKQ